KENRPYGYIYKATNTINGKVYIGKTKKTIEKRWSQHLNEADKLKSLREANPNEKIWGSHLNNAIIKYGANVFSLNQEDIGDNKAELLEKEKYYIKEYDSMNPDKGYNMTEGGEGGRPRQEVIERMTEISRERAKDPEWLEKMTNINQEIARNPETIEKMSKSLSKKWQEQQYQEKVSKGATDKWQEVEHRKRQFTARREGRREIPDKGEFLKDIQDMKKKNINSKYDMDGKSINKRIEGMLGHHGVKNFSQAKKYLENKNLDKVLNDINEKLDNQTHKIAGKKEISNTREFLEDIQNLKTKEIEQKYNMNRSTVTKRVREMLGDKGVKNFTDTKEYLKDKDLDEVVKDINERRGDQTQKFEGKSVIENKREFLEDIQNLQKNEIDHKYGIYNFFQIFYRP
ncbi:MAG: GIY-YIG nuclease family protein, partial [Promethearchaeota archaeon]